MDLFLPSLWVDTALSGHGCGRAGATGGHHLFLPQAHLYGRAPTISSFGETLERAWQRRSDWQNMGKAARARAEALIPKNPIAVFCEKLKSCVEAGPEIVTTGDMTRSEEHTS